MGTELGQGKGNDGETEELEGYVKWFDQTKGFGFVVAGGGGPDILLHANVLRNFGQGSIADGTPLTVRAQKTARGMQAVEIMRIGNAGGASGPENEAFPTYDVDLDTLEFMPARVKWFDKTKGFGFANVFGSNDDVFIHVETLRRFGFADLQPGEAVSIKLLDGERGLMAVEIRSWDTAVQR